MLSITITVFRSSYKKEKKKEEAVMCRIRRETEQSSDYPEAVSVRQSGGREKAKLSNLLCICVLLFSIISYNYYVLMCNILVLNHSPELLSIN
jgi:hypothetical protein